MKHMNTQKKNLQKEIEMSGNEKGESENEYLSGDRREKLGEGHALYGFQGKRGACFLCDI